MLPATGQSAAFAAFEIFGDNVAEQLPYATAADMHLFWRRSTTRKNDERLYTLRATHQPEQAVLCTIEIVVQKSSLMRLLDEMIPQMTTPVGDHTSRILHHQAKETVIRLARRYRGKMSVDAQEETSEQQIAADRPLHIRLNT